ncbi:DNA-3-methyladenine glycosylase family protein [Oceanirhabdus sp. W0125-5]|uniref:DNA-3-methyladenine glycosylase family protein n=1 Tax=Oceanirhabdus sp. W0125-5 TaxID=2999116 RepID=UPI0022F30002|nr:DNA-3-methyladenine glycosylase [Oceanirhabdus sp. W0125-5]WBW98566.1 DNA-3-methyladenine glycosylase [Oceanirhabdus sp. W0125-5]
MSSYSKIEISGPDIIIKDIQNFELRDIFDCGQAFRWNKTESGSYIGVAFGRVLEVRKRENDVIFYDCSMEEFNNTWIEYFDLERDYSKIIEELSVDETLKMACDFGKGMRLLQQEPFELTISFIISANNQIPRIKRSIERISERWGRKIYYKGNEYYAFPTVDELREAGIEELEQCGVGFRAKYIYETIQRVLSDKDILNRIKSLDDDGCHKELMEFKGIGPKVADCIMLFSMQKYSAFPVDVWVKRAMQHFYVAPDVTLPKIRKYGREKFGELGGFAQQYLFYYARENNIL